MSSGVAGTSPAGFAFVPKSLLRAILLVPVAAATGAAAQSYPTKPVRVLVGYAPGGSVDSVARTLSKSLTAAYGRQVIVDNRPGAASHIAGAIVAKADPDGYTLLVSSTGGLGTNKALYAKIPYDALTDLTPLALLVHQAHVAIVNTAASPRTLKELIALAKSKPGQLNYGSAGVGGGIHMATALLMSMAGIKMTHVPYKGGALALVDLLAGHIDVTVQPVPEALPFIKNGRVRALGVTSEKRSASLPDVPTIAEAGVPGYEHTGWMGAAGPAGMAKALAARISADINKALATPEVQSTLLGLGLEIAGSTPEQLGQHMRDELDKTIKLVKDAGIPTMQ